MIPALTWKESNGPRGGDYRLLSNAVAPRHHLNVEQVAAILLHFWNRYPELADEYERSIDWVFGTSPRDIGRIVRTELREYGASAWRWAGDDGPHLLTARAVVRHATPDAGEMELDRRPDVRPFYLDEFLYEHGMDDGHMEVEVVY